jgi:ABC-type branched-subunit amino acid transport system permease subunit
MAQANPRALTIFFLVALVGLVLFPLTGSVFYQQLLTKVMILSIFAMSLDLLIGYTGLVSLGHAAFFGLAGYSLALIQPKYGRAWPMFRKRRYCSHLRPVTICATATGQPMMMPFGRRQNRPMQPISCANFHKG